jgi:hypothetical protein
VTRDQWRRTNTDPEFLKWLDGVHDLSGERRLDILRRAEQYGNVQPIVQLFKSFLVSRMPGARTEQLAYHNPPKPGAPSSTKRWRREEIKAFYDACRRGEYLKKEAERAATEADIIAAAREGRVDRLPLRLTKGFSE